MKTKHVALFFIYLFTFNYILGAVATAHGASREKRSGGYYPGPGGFNPGPGGFNPGPGGFNPGPGGNNPSTGGCRLTPQCQMKLETCFLQIRNEMPDDFELPEQRLEEYELTQGTASGFRNFVWEPFQCTCTGDAVRIHVRVNFLRILLTFVMNLLDDLLGGLLGSLGSGLAKLLGNVVNLVVRILALQIIVEITIVQRFIPGTKCVVESYRVSKVTTIRLLGLDLAPLVQILSPLLTPIVDALLQAILNDRVKAVFLKEIGKVEITRSEVIC